MNQKSFPQIRERTTTMTSKNTWIFEQSFKHVGPPMETRSSEFQEYLCGVKGQPFTETGRTYKLDATFLRRPHNASYVLEHIRCGKSARTVPWWGRLGNGSAYPISSMLYALGGIQLKQQYGAAECRQVYLDYGERQTTRSSANPDLRVNSPENTRKPSRPCRRL